MTDGVVVVGKSRSSGVSAVGTILREVSSDGGDVLSSGVGEQVGGRVAFINLFNLVIILRRASTSKMVR